MTGNQPTCPRDGAVLVSGELESIPFHKCPQCHGVYLTASRVTELLERMIDRLKKDPRAFRLAPAVPDRGDGVACPDCGAEMANGPYDDSSVMIDRCDACDRLWLDTFELGAICVHHAKKHHDLDLRPLTRAGTPAKDFVAWWLMMHFIPLEIDLGI